MAAAAAVAMCGCGSSAAQREAEASASESAARQQAADDCLDIWVNNYASQRFIDAGSKPYDDASKASPPVITVVDGRYHVDNAVLGFGGWSQLGVPWDTIKGSMLDGDGCPFVPADPSLPVSDFDRQFNDCLDVWLDTEAPQSTIDRGMAPFSNGRITFPAVITQVGTGQYHADITQGMGPFEELGIFWSDMKMSIRSGGGCPYVAGS
ncbi:MAG: hypothetical protein FWF36_09400 [Propionibacteriaceae bacterium]|nr:hypothetical protein [Propionibacteriaceae bacterium]